MKPFKRNLKKTDHIRSRNVQNHQKNVYTEKTTVIMGAKDYDQTRVSSQYLTNLLRPVGTIEYCSFNRNLRTSKKKKTVRDKDVGNYILFR